MALYRLVLDRQEFINFRARYSEYFYANYTAPELIEVDTNVKNKGFGQIIFGGGTRAFKIRPLTPNFVIDLFVEKCWKCYSIQNEKKYTFWLPFARGIISFFIIFLVFSLLVMVDASLPNWWYIVAILFGVAATIIGLVAFSMEDGIEELSGGDKLKLILPHIIYSTYLAGILKNINISTSNTIDRKSYSTGSNTSYLKSPSDQVPVETLDDKILSRKKELSEQIDNEISSLDVNIPDEAKQKLKDFILNKRIENELNEIDPENFPEDIIKQRAEDLEILEQKKLAHHLLFEGRISYVNKQKIKSVLGYKCMACGMELKDKYGELGKGYIELHHIVPYSDMHQNDERVLKISDFYVLCPNCHSMIHKLDDVADLELLKNIVEFNKIVQAKGSSVF